MSSTRASAEGRTLAIAAVSRNTAYGAAFLTLGVILGLVENALGAPAVLPWVRFGLANAAVVAALALVGVRCAAIVSIGRVFVIGVVSGTLGGPGTLMAIAGAVASLVVMAGLRRVRGLTVVGWSAAGSVAHMCAQLLAAVALTGSWTIWALAPISLLASLIVGVVVGLLSHALVSRLPKGLYAAS